MANPNFTIQEICNRLSYDPDTGIFIWVKPRSNVRQPGDRAGTNKGRGYRRISIDNVLVYEHRLAWFITTGKWPNGEVDHIDGNPSNNAISNLRLSTHRENMQNLGLRSTSTSGFAGVSWSKQHRKWEAYIWKDNKKRNLGLFKSKYEARDRYLDAKRALHIFQPTVRPA